MKLGLPRLASRFLIAIAVTVLIAQFCLTWLEVCGTSSAAILGVLCGLAVGFGIASITAKSLDHSSVYLRVVCTLGVVGLSLLTSTLLDTMLALGVIAADLGGLAVGASFALPATYGSVFSWAISTWAISFPAIRGRRFEPIMLVGVACGCLVPIAHSLVVIPLAFSACAFVFVGAVAGWLDDNKRENDDCVSDWTTPFSARELLFAAAVGIYLQAGLRIMFLLVPGSPALLLAACALCLILTIPAGTQLGSRLLRRTEARCAVAAMIVLLPAAFSTLIDLNLQWNATVASALQVFGIRVLQLSLIFTPAGLISRMVVSDRETQTGRSPFTLISACILGLAAGFVCQSIGLPVAFQVLAASSFLIYQLVSHSRIHRGFAGAAMATGLLIALLVQIDSAATSQKLFSARTASGLRRGLSLDLVEQSQCNRLIDAAHSETGHLTVWKTSADMLEIRRHGVPAGLISSNESTTPQSLAEVLTAVLPLSMHPNPQRVMVLSDDVGVSTRVCCNFPISQIHAVRTDSVTTEFASQYVWNSLATPPQEDERVEFRHEPVAAAIRRLPLPGRSFDVVIAASPNPMSLMCQQQLTTQFYNNVRSQLSDDGVFCQRITQHDLGAQPVHKILSTVSSVFPRVIVIQIANGEVAMIAGVSKDSLLDGRLLDRLQRPHVARELSRSGWDWSQVAALPVVDTQDTLGIWVHDKPTTPVTAGSGYFAIGLPLEAARWGDKSGELRQMFGPHQQRMADAAAESKSYAEFARRYSSVVQQMEIVTTFYDQPWAYRNSLKTEMQRNSRPAIEKVKGGRITQEADPRDEYRKHYFVTLGAVLDQAREGFADPLALKKLMDFTRSYEPLLSYFAHYELIRIHEATAHPGPAMELRHRLHTIFFADGRDYSIRQITAAMNQIVEDPQLLPDDESRFDHLNALLQELVRRWEGRRNYAPKSARRTQADIDESVSIANLALDMMEQLAPAVELPRYKFLARRKFINRSLVTPLREYGEQVLAHRIKTEPAISPLSPAVGGDELPLLLSDDAAYDRDATN